MTPNLSVSNDHSVEQLTSAGTDRALYNSTPPGEARQKLRDDGYAANVRQWLRLHAEAIRSGHADAPPSARGKYVWLARYHNEIAEAQVGDDSCNCVLA